MRESHPGSQQLSLITPESRRTPLQLQAAMVVVGDAINFMSGIVSAMILARVISQHDMGTYKQITTTGTLLLTLGEMGLVSSVYRFWSKLEQSQKPLFATSIFLFLGLVGVVCGVALFLAAPIIANMYNNDELTLSIRIASPFILGSIVPMMVRPILLAEGFSLRATGFELILATTTIFAMIIPLLLGQPFSQALKIWSLSIMMNVPLTFLALRKYLRWTWPFRDTELLRHVWEYAWPLQVGKIPSVTSNYLDKATLSLMVSPQSFAIYSLGARELPFVGRISSSISQVMIPRMVEQVEKGQHEALFTLWRSACTRTALLIYPIAAFSFVNAKPIVTLLFSSQYIESSGPFRIFSLFLFIRVITYGSIAKATGNSKAILISSILATVTAAISAYPLVHIFGMNGMAIAVLNGTISSSIYLLLTYRKFFNVAISRFFPFQKLIAIAIFSFVSVFIASIMQSILKFHYDPNNMFQVTLYLGFLAAIASIVYSIIILFWRRHSVGLIRNSVKTLHNKRV